MTEAVSEWRRGWPTIASSMLGVVFMTVVPSVTGMVMAPLMAAFGWSRALIASSVLITAILTLVLAPVAGRLIARFGVRRYALASVSAAVPGLLLIAAAGGPAWTWIAAWIVYGVIAVGLGPLVWSTAIAGLFDRTRGLALAVAFSGSGIAFFLFPPFTAALLQRFGWRGVYVGLAVLMLTALLPLSALWFRAVDDLPGAGGAVARPVRTGAGDAPRALAGMTMAEVLRTRQFWQIALLSMLVAMGEGTLTLHLFPIVREGGLSMASAVWVTSLIGVSLIVGRLLNGVLLDRLPATLVLASAIGFVLLGCLVARAYAGSLAGAAMFSLLLGLGAGGTTSALAYLTSRYFGLRAYASVLGLVMGTFSIGYGVAPVIAGVARAMARSYAPMFVWLAAALILSALLTLTLGRPPVLADGGR